MKILSFSDIHGKTENFSYIQDEIDGADLIFLAGDITHFGKAAEISIILDKITFDSSKIFGIPGNCDYPEVNIYLENKNSSLHCHSFEKNGITFLGVGFSLPCPGTTPGEVTDEDFKLLFDQALQGIPKDQSTVFLIHQPPYNTLNDRIGSGAHVGSRSIRNVIEEYQPLVCFMGHIHEGVGIDSIGKTKTINPGMFRHGGYAYVELDDGVQTIEIRQI
ncbi:MAG: metallophosphoesterase [Proteobacteria bacterium]|nr:metallophosphoesterase [Pseudomonadota bacterium]